MKPKMVKGMQFDMAAKRNAAMGKIVAKRKRQMTREMGEAKGKEIRETSEKKELYA